MGKQVRIPLSKKPKDRLGIDFSNTPETRRKKLVAKAKRIGEGSVVAKLNAIGTLNKNRNPELTKKARADARFIASRFKGKKRVRSPGGLSSG